MKKAALVALASLALLSAGCGGGESSPPKPAAKPQAAKPQAAKPQAAKPSPSAMPTAAKPAAKPAATPASGAAPSSPVTMAETIFTTRCTPCHGASGHGDGVAAAALNPKPRNYSDKTWQASITDEAIAKAIVGGGASVGLSALMPPNPDLADKPEVVKALVAKIRGFGK